MFGLPADTLTRWLVIDGIVVGLGVGYKLGSRNVIAICELQVFQCRELEWIVRISIFNVVWNERYGAKSISFAILQRVLRYVH